MVKKRPLVWLAVGAVLLASWIITGSVAPDSSLTAVSAALASLWIVISAVVGSGCSGAG
jgi:hypothetical protein